MKIVERQLQQERDSQEGDQTSSTLTEATAQWRVIAWIRPHLKPFLTHLFALVLGSGAVWQYFQLDIQRENQANDIRTGMLVTFFLCFKVDMGLGIIVGVAITKAVNISKYLRRNVQNIQMKEYFSNCYFQ